MPKPKDVIEEATDVLEAYQSNGAEEGSRGWGLMMWIPYVIPASLLLIAILLDIADHDSLARWMYGNVALTLLGVKFGILRFPKRRKK